MTVMALSGLAGSGKDTVAEILCEDQGFVQVAFADVLKRVLQDVYGFTDEQLWGPSEKRNEQDKRYPMEMSHGAKIVDKDANGDWKPHCLSPRKALHILGDAFRECYPYTTVDYGLRVGEQLLDKTEQQPWQYDLRRGLYKIYDLRGSYQARGIVFSDVRLWRELSRIKAAGGKVVRVTRPGAGLKGEEGKHLTESEMATIPDGEFHHVLVNDGSLDELRSKVAAMVAAFGVLGKA